MRKELAALWILIACGSETTDRCLNAPTYTQDIAPISQAKCVPCHAPDADRRGAPLDLDFDSWPAIEPVVAEFADALTSGRQPPEGFTPAVTSDDVEVVRQWRACGFRE